MSVLETVKVILTEELDRVATEIEIELKNEVAKHHRTGETERGIHITRDSEWSRFIGSNYEGLKYLDEGNSPTNKFIAFKPYPSWDKGIRPYPSRNGIVYSHGRKGYDGFGIIKTVADKHR